MRLSPTLAWLALLGLASFASAQEDPRPSVIFFIGDGMGASQITLGRFGAQAQGRPYQLDRFRTVGLAGTRSASHEVTDSAASATALACGIKTNNKVVGLDAWGRARESVMELAHEADYATGLVTSTRITHATPASFVGHVPHRREEKTIAAQMAARDFPEVLIGGGARNFTPELRAQMRGHGYAVVDDMFGLAGAHGPRVAALLAKSHLPYQVDGGPSLVALTRRAVELLDEQGPFFLMVEGGRIDHACHAHDAASAIHEQLDFDRAVGWALDWAAARPEVLVLVTADHATGNLGISETVQIDALLAAKASTEKLGRPRVESGDAAGLEAFLARCREAYGLELTPAEGARVFERPGGYWPSTALGHIVSDRLGVFFYGLEDQEDRLTNTHGHDGAMVPVFAAGRGAEHFAGLYENVEIPRRIARILGLAQPGALLGARQQVAPRGRFY